MSFFKNRSGFLKNNKPRPSLWISSRGGERLVLLLCFSFVRLPDKPPFSYGERKLPHRTLPKSERKKERGGRPIGGGRMTFFLAFQGKVRKNVSSFPCGVLFLIGSFSSKKKSRNFFFRRSPFSPKKKGRNFFFRKRFFSKEKGPSPLSEQPRNRYWISPKRRSASFAACCSASRLEEPFPLPMTLLFSIASTSKSFLCAGPLSETTKYSGCSPRSA